MFCDLSDIFYSLLSVLHNTQGRTISLPINSLDSRTWPSRTHTLIKWMICNVRAKSHAIIKLKNKGVDLPVWTRRALTIPYFWEFLLLRSIVFGILFSLSLVVKSYQGSYIPSSSPSRIRFVPIVVITRRLQPFLPSSTSVELRLRTLGTPSSLSFFLFLEI